MRNSTSKLSFKRLTSLKLENFAEGIKNGIYKNIEPFIQPIISLEAFTIILLVFSDKRKAYEVGGISQKIAYKTAMDLLITQLISLAEYVDGIAKGSADIIKLAGFEATYDPAVPKRNKAPINITGLSIVRDNEKVGNLKSDCGTLPKGTICLGILSEGAPLPANINLAGINLLIQSGELSNKIILDLSIHHKKVWTNLTLGVTYYCYYITINNYGVSSLSNEAKMSA